MIKLLDNYVLRVNKGGYSLEESTSDEFRQIGTYDNISGALKALAHDLARKKLRSGTYTLGQAAGIFRETNAYLHDYVKAEIDKND